ncbi:MAG: hypothetical protein ACI4MF_08170, partial [Candidatus Faecivicinus sp.]
MQSPHAEGVRLYAALVLNAWGTRADCGKLCFCLSLAPITGQPGIEKVRFLLFLMKGARFPQFGGNGLLCQSRETLNFCNLYTDLNRKTKERRSTMATLSLLLAVIGTILMLIHYATHSI